MWSEDNSDNQLLIPIPQSWITNSYSDSTNFIGICYPAIIQLWPWMPPLYSESVILSWFNTLMHIVVEFTLMSAIRNCYYS